MVSIPGTATYSHTIAVPLTPPAIPITRIAPNPFHDQLEVGLYLPASAVDAQAVQAGTVVATGPGTPISAPTELGDEPWKIGTGEARYMPVQARAGDYAIFFRRAAVEITFEGTKYLVVPQAAILVIVRGQLNEDDL